MTGSNHKQSWGSSCGTNTAAIKYHRKFYPRKISQNIIYETHSHKTGQPKCPISRMADLVILYLHCVSAEQEKT
jgi:hypothetical protein